MKYRKVSVEHRDLINRFLIRENRKLCEYCFTDIFLWKDKYRTEFCIEDDILYMRQYNKNENMYGLGVPSKSYNSMAAGKALLFIGPAKSEIYDMIKNAGIEMVINRAEEE